MHFISKCLLTEDKEKEKLRLQKLNEEERASGTLSRLSGEIDTVTIALDLSKRMMSD